MKGELGGEGRQLQALSCSKEPFQTNQSQKDRRLVRQRGGKGGGKGEEEKVKRRLVGLSRQQADR